MKNWTLQPYKRASKQARGEIQQRGMNRYNFVRSLTNLI